MALVSEAKTTELASDPAHFPAHSYRGHPTKPTKPDPSVWRITTDPVKRSLVLTVFLTLPTKFL